MCQVLIIHYLCPKKYFLSKSRNLEWQLDRWAEPQASRVKQLVSVRCQKEDYAYQSSALPMLLGNVDLLLSVLHKVFSLESNVIPNNPPCLMSQ